MNAQMITGHHLGHLGDDLFDLVGQRAAVGVAQHHPARPRIVSRLHAGHGIVRIVLVAVKEVLGVEYGFPPDFHRMGD